MDEGRCIKFPKLYILGQQNVLFNTPIFARSVLKGIFHAIVIFFVLMGCYYLNFYSGDGYEVDYQSIGYIASGALTFVVTFQVHSMCVCLCMYCGVHSCGCLFVYDGNQICLHVGFLFPTDCPRHLVLDCYHSYFYMGQYSVVVYCYHGCGNFTVLPYPTGIYLAILPWCSL